MPAQFWSGLLNTPGHLASGTALASSSTLTAISPSSTTQPDFVLPANWLYPGSVLRFTFAAIFSTTVTPTLNLGVYYGGTGGVLLAATGAITTTSGAANQAVLGTFTTMCRSIGSSGTVTTFGSVTGITSATAPAVNVATQASAPTGAFATATVDTTSAKALVLGATWGTNSASNTITCHQWLIEALN